jgi:hypothetical protein
MDTSMQRKPKIRLGKKKKFIVEANVDAIQWPQECAVCGKPVEIYDDNEDKSTTFMNCYKVTPPKVPYCQTCYKKVKTTKRLDGAIYLWSGLFSIPLGLLLAYSFYLTLEKITKTELLCLGLISAIGFVAGMSIIKFLIRGPIKAIFKNRYTNYVQFYDINERISDTLSVWNLEINIPNKLYAAKFAALNSVEPEADKKKR